MAPNIGESWRKTTTNSCKNRLTVFLSRLKNYKLENLVVERALVNFSLMSDEGWMKLAIQVKISSMISVSVRPGSKLIEK